jgi:hypothetical protein
MCSTFKNCDADLLQNVIGQQKTTAASQNTLTKIGNKMFADQVMAHAKAHYTDGGWDVIVECWDNDELNELLADCHGIEHEAWRVLESLVDVWSDRQADARNSAF